MKCPGQDRGYWSGDRVFDLPCPKCGAAVEFFRDEAKRRCTRCGYAFPNARIALDCASWCEQAEACLGISRSGGNVRADAETALSGRLIHALEEELGADSDLFARSLLVFQHARELVPAVGVAPTVVLPAALLLECVVASDPTSRLGDVAASEDTKVRGMTERVLSRGGLEDRAIQEVYGLLHAYCQGRRDRPELAVLNDASRLAVLVAQRAAAASTDLPGNPSANAEGGFLTEAGTARARGLFES